MDQEFNGSQRLIHCNQEMRVESLQTTQEYESRAREVTMNELNQQGEALRSSLMSDYQQFAQRADSEYQAQLRLQNEITRSEAHQEIIRNETLVSSQTKEELDRNRETYIQAYSSFKAKSANLEKEAETYVSEARDTYEGNNRSLNASNDEELQKKQQERAEASNKLLDKANIVYENNQNAYQNASEAGR